VPKFIYIGQPEFILLTFENQDPIPLQYITLQFENQDVNSIPNNFTQLTFENQDNTIL
jgi:hypothetical protein